MADLDVYKVDLNTPQPNGRLGETPRAAFTKYNDLVDVLDTDLPPKSSTAQAQAGTDDTAYMTPLKTAQAISAIDRNGNFDNLAALQGSTQVKLGQFVRTLGYYTPGDGGGNDYEIVSAGTGTDDGGSFIDLSGSGLQAKGLFLSGVSVKQFGAAGDGVINDSPPIQAAFNYINEKGELFAPKGVYKLDSQIVVDMSSFPGVATEVNFRGQGPQSTIFTVDGNSNTDGAFSFIKEGGNLINLTLKSFQVLAISESGPCGIAVEAVSAKGGADEKWTIVMEDVYTDTEDRLVTETGGVNDVANPAHFVRSYSFIETGRIYLKNVMANHPQQNNGLGSPEITFADGSASYLSQTGIYMQDIYKPVLDHVTVKNCSTCVVLRSVNRASEGFILTDVNLVNAKIGLRVFKDPEAPAGVEPEFAFIGGHVNFRDEGLRIESRQDGIIDDILFYQSNSDESIGAAFPSDIKLIESRNVKILGCEFGRDMGRTDRRMIWLESIGPGAPADTRNVLTVVGNNFNATAESAVHIVPTIDMPVISGNNYSSLLSRHIRFSGRDIRGNASPQDLSGQYIPSVISSTNVESSSVHDFAYAIIGSTVYFTGVIGINPISGNTQTEVELSLPPFIPNLASAILHNIQGVAATQPNSFASESGVVSASSGDNILIQAFPSGTANRVYFVSGTILGALNNV